LYFVVCKFNLYSDDAPVCRKPLAIESLKKTIKPMTDSQTIPLVITAMIPPPVGVTGSMVVSPVKAWDHCRCAAKFLEGLKNR
jgi:hypothetical protein